MPKENEKISVTIKANLKKRDPDTKEIIEEEETTYEISGNEAKQLMKQKGANPSSVKKKKGKGKGKHVIKNKNKLKAEMTTEKLKEILRKKGVDINGTS